VTGGEGTCLSGQMSMLSLIRACARLTTRVRR
jgi:hypothetical protein